MSDQSNHNRNPPEPPPPQYEFKKIKYWYRDELYPPKANAGRASADTWNYWLRWKRTLYTDEECLTKAVGITNPVIVATCKNRGCQDYDGVGDRVGSVNHKALLTHTARCQAPSIPDGQPQHARQLLNEKYSKQKNKKRRLSTSTDQDERSEERSDGEPESNNSAVRPSIDMDPMDIEQKECPFPQPPPPTNPLQMPTVRNFKNFGTLYSDIKSLYGASESPDFIPFTEFLPPSVSRKVSDLLIHWVLVRGHHFGILWEEELLEIFRYLLGPNWNPPNRNHIGDRGVDMMFESMMDERDRVCVHVYVYMFGEPVVNQHIKPNLTLLTAHSDYTSQ